MRNKCTPKRGGDTGRNASNRSAPKKDSKPDKSKGLANHVFSSGKLEDFQKTHEHLMSCMRLNYDNGHDIVSATENGEACDFSKEMPKTSAPRAPTEKQLQGSPDLQQEHEDEAKSLEMMLKVQLQGTKSEVGRLISQFQEFAKVSSRQHPNVSGMWTRQF